MRFEQLIFQEIDDSLHQAVVDLGNGYRIQIILDDVSGNSDCNLYTPQGEILDEVEGEDKKGVEYFIEQSQLLIEDIKFWDESMNDECVLISKEELVK